MLESNSFGHKLRILCLHGGRTNTSVITFQTQGLRKALGDRAEFFYINAPNVSEKASDPTVAQLFQPPYYEWWDSHTIEKTIPGTSQVEKIYEYHGLEKTLGYMMTTILQQGPFDVILGFSQGAAVAGLMTSYFQHELNGQIPWKVCILAGGLKPRAASINYLFENAFGVKHIIPIPSIHIMGKADPILDLSRNYVTYFQEEKRSVFEHEEGHKWPSASFANQQFYRDIADTLLEYCQL